MEIKNQIQAIEDRQTNWIEMVDIDTSLLRIRVYGKAVQKKSNYDLSTCNINGRLISTKIVNSR